MMTANRIFCVVPTNEQFGASTVPLLAPALEGGGACDQRAVMGAFCLVWFTLITTGQANEAWSTRPKHSGSCLNSASLLLPNAPTVLLLFTSIVTFPVISETRRDGQTTLERDLFAKYRCCLLPRVQLPVDAS